MTPPPEPTDAAVPAIAGLPPLASAVRRGVAYRSRRFTPPALAALVEHLTRAGPAALAAVERRQLAAAWGDVVEVFADPTSAERRRLAAPLARLSGLSPAGLDAALDTVLGGVRRALAEELVEDAPRCLEPSPAWVVLASNLPALAVQPLLPALAVGRPVLIKSPSAEPLFAPAFVAALGRRLPPLADAVAAVTWPGGDRELEEVVLARAGKVLAYGGAATMADLGRRAGRRLLAYGPKLSLAVIGAGAATDAVAAGLARDVALFDQRGCLSIQAVYAAGDAVALARRLARQLGALAERWPPGELTPQATARVQELRATAAMRGLEMPPLPLASGTVIVEPRPQLEPSPGLRTVRIHPLSDFHRLPALLAGWRGRLQGAALAGEEAWALAPRLEALGISRCAAPGELQSADASWHNGGVSPLAALAA